jgi:hypothetical protein
MNDSPNEGSTATETRWDQSWVMDGDNLADHLGVDRAVLEAIVEGTVHASIVIHREPPRVARGRFWVYRLLDAEDRVLYVGSTRALGNRLKAHRRRWGSTWVRHVAFECETAAEMLTEERAQIRRFQPPLNVTDLP